MTMQTTVAPFARDPTAPRRAVDIAEAVVGFVEWMREHGSEFAGRWWSVEDIDEFWAWYCDEAWIGEAHPHEVRVRLLQLPGVVSERRRIGAPQYEALRRYLGRLTSSRPDREKWSLWRVATADEMAAMEPKAARRPAKNGRGRATAADPVQVRHAA